MSRMCGNNTWESGNNTWESGNNTYGPWEQGVPYGPREYPMDHGSTLRTTEDTLCAPWWDTLCAPW